MFIPSLRTKYCEHCKSRIEWANVCPSEACFKKRILRNTIWAAKEKKKEKK